MSGFNNYMKEVGDYEWQVVSDWDCRPVRVSKYTESESFGNPVTIQQKLLVCTEKLGEDHIRYTEATSIEGVPDEVLNWHGAGILYVDGVKVEK